MTVGLRRCTVTVVAVVLLKTAIGALKAEQAGPNRQGRTSP
jgi:hypothetical protein